MEKKLQLTNEYIAKKFRNNFDLVLYAIKAAESMIRSGRGPRVRSNTENKAMIIVDEIAAGKDHLDDVGITSDGFISDITDELDGETFVFEQEHRAKMQVIDEVE